MLWKISVGKTRPFFNAQKSVEGFLPTHYNALGNAGDIRSPRRWS